MKIIGLNIENVKKIRALEIHPQGNTVLITGANGQGKSTVLDSIFMALAGKVSVDPITHGESRSEIRVNLGEYIVTKTITEKGDYLKVENAEGAKFASPQSLLDKLIGDLSFDPLEFAGLKSRDQRETLLQLIGVDLKPLEKRKKELYDERTIVGREGKALRGKFDLLPVVEDAPEELIDVQELYERIRIEKQKELSSQRLIDGIEDNRANIERRRNEIKELRKRIERIEADIHADELGIESMEDELSGLAYDYADMEQKLAGAEDLNQKFRANQERQEAEEILNAKRDEYDKLTKKIEAVDSEKDELLRSADLPIEGLSIDEDGIRFQGVRFSELSSAEQLRVSLAIAIKQNPKLKVISIKDGSLLDSRSLQIIEDMAKDSDYQVWIERVDETGKVGVYIEDGVITSVDGLPVMQKGA